MYAGNSDTTWRVVLLVPSLATRPANSATVTARDMVPATSRFLPDSARLEYPGRPDRCGPRDTLSLPVRSGQIEICHTSSSSRLSVIDAATVRSFVIYISTVQCPTIHSFRDAVLDAARSRYKLVSLTIRSHTLCGWYSRRLLHI